MKMQLTIALAILVGILVLACSSSGPAPVEPTPNIEATVEARLSQDRAVNATVEARLKEEKASIPTATPVPTYTPIPTYTPDPIPSPTGTISAVDLVEEFTKNAVAANQRYSGLDLVVEGEVAAIDYDFLGSPYVSVGSGDLYEFNTVWCMVSDVSDVAELSIGDEVTVEGTFSEWDSVDVILKPCSP